ncbi:MAG: hypothetical protein LBG78_04445 [Azoarcus sp.]|nr:hypothetical protein [Azoarcus sp.]
MRSEAIHVAAIPALLDGFVASLLAMTGLDLGEAGMGTIPRLWLVGFYPLPEGEGFRLPNSGGLPKNDGTPHPDGKPRMDASTRETSQKTASLTGSIS